MTGGAAPPAAIIEAMQDLGMEAMHLYRLDGNLWAVHRRRVARRME
jgi:hypothetical protein